MIRDFESTGTVNLIDTFFKDGTGTPMSPLFGVENGKIKRIPLIFDTAAFSRDVESMPEKIPELFTTPVFSGQEGLLFCSL